MNGFESIRQFKRDFRPKENIDYSWVIAYATDRCKQHVKDFEDLDSKAAFIITFLSGGIGALAIGSVALPIQIPGQVTGFFAIPIMLALVAICNAFQCRRTVDVPAGLTIEEAVSEAEEHDKSSQARFLGYLHFAGEIQLAVNNRKAEKADAAGSWALWSVVSLLIPFVAGVVWRWA